MRNMGNKLNLNTSSSKPFRILILGLPGSGKSTLAKSLADQLQIRHLECDQYIHHNNFHDTIAQEITSDNFVIEGRFKDLKSLFMQQEWTHVIWLNPSFAVNLWRLLKREIQKHGLRQALSREGTLRFFMKNHQRLRNMQKESFHILKTNEMIQTVII